jgi:hypothetical protein
MPPIQASKFTFPVCLANRDLRLGLFFDAAAGQFGRNYFRHGTLKTSTNPERAAIPENSVVEGVDPS